MKNIFKKISAVAASALMVGMTMGVVAAANYPAPFVVGGSANVAIVYGTGAGVNPSDLVQASYVQSNLQSFMSSTGSSTTVSGGDSWEVGTSSDKLELGESIRDVETYIGRGELGLLVDGSLSNEKGEAKYEQFFYFEDTTSSAVNFTENDDEVQALFLNFKSDQVIARYVMDFTNELKSDIETDKELSDIEDKAITFLGKTYTIVTADNGTKGVELTLMSGALGGTVDNDVPLTLDGYEVSVLVSSSSAAEFTVNGQKTAKMGKGDMEKLSDGNYLAVTDITYQGFAGGIMNADFYIGADKITWKNGTSMTANAETINEANVIITHTESSGDISISEIAINMTAEDDLFIPVGGKLSEVVELTEPEVLVGQNWDIQFEGLEAVDYETISLKRSTDLKYVLEWENYNGDTVKLPLVYTDVDEVIGGSSSTKNFVINPNGSILGLSHNITDKDYFLLHTANPEEHAKDAKTLLIYYKSADKHTATDPKITFTVNPGSNPIDKEMSVSSTGTFTFKYAGGTWNFRNSSDGTTDYDIVLVGDDYHEGTAANATAYVSIRTGYNTRIQITDVVAIGPAESAGVPYSDDEDMAWRVNVSIDDTSKDGDETNAQAALAQQVFQAEIDNSTAATAIITFAGTAAWKTDPDDSTISTYVTQYGAEILRTNPSDSPANIVVQVPKSIVRPLVYVSTGDVAVSTTVGGATSLGDVLVKDTEVSSVSSKNLVVVGGSCINSAAATLVGSAACESDFTSATGIGSGQFLIQSFADAYTSGKIALLVAGYSAADTINAVTYLKTQTVDTEGGKKYKGTSSTSASLVVE